MAERLGKRQATGGRRVDEVVSHVARLLAANGEIDDAVREARDIVAALVDAPRHWAIVNEATQVDGVLHDRAVAAARRRAQGAPLAYAVGTASFRSLTLQVDERVLIPRPETELLVDIVLTHVGTRAGGTIVDVGTGSGAIAIALATEGQFARVIATDISTDALAVASANALRIGARVEFACGHLLRACDELLAGPGEPRAGSRESLRAVVSNLPYISYSEIRELPKSVRDWEPAMALFSGDDGLALTAGLVRQAARRLGPGGLLALEVDARRALLVAELVGADQRFANVAVQLDLAGRERFVLATRRES